MTEWRPSGPEPAKDGPGDLSRPAQTAINSPEVRNAGRPGNPFELPDAPRVTRPPVIILTAAEGTASCPGGDRDVRADGYLSGFARFPRRP